jgi:hypothetical protein
MQCAILPYYLAAARPPFTGRERLAPGGGGTVCLCIGYLDAIPEHCWGRKAREGFTLGPGCWLLVKV